MPEFPESHPAPAVEPDSPEASVSAWTRFRHRLAGLFSARTRRMMDLEWRLSEDLARSREEARGLRDRLLDAETDRRKLESDVKILELEVVKLTNVCQRDLMRVQAEQARHAAEAALRERQQGVAA